LYRNQFGFQAILKKQIKNLFLSAVWCFIVLGLLAFFTTNANNRACAKTGKGEEGWVIRQNSNFAGTVFSDLTDHALKMHIGRLGLTIITKAPAWNALIFNENTKKYVDLPYKRWQQRFIFSDKSNYRDSSGKLSLLARNTGKMNEVDHFKTYECLVIKKGDVSKNIPEEKISQLWIASDIKAPPQIAQIFCSHLAIPAQKGIPLKASRCVNGKMISALETLSVERRFIPASTFESLPNYKKVKDELELVMSESTNEAMEDLLDVPTSHNESHSGKKK